MKVKSENEVAQSCPTLSDPMDCSLPGSSVHGIFQARVLECGDIAFSIYKVKAAHNGKITLDPMEGSLMDKNNLIVIVTQPLCRNAGKPFPCPTKSQRRRDDCTLVASAHRELVGIVPTIPRRESSQHKQHFFFSAA